MRPSFKETLDMLVARGYLRGYEEAWFSTVDVELADGHMDVVQEQESEAALAAALMSVQDIPLCLAMDSGAGARYTVVTWIWKHRLERGY